MAYPYYNFSPYQSYYTQQIPQYQQFQAQQYQPQIQQQPASQPTNYAGRIWVNGRNEADFYPVAPNNAVDLWDRDGKTLYQKKADATGKPSVIVCDVVERAQSVSDGTPAEDVKTPAYATKDELSAVVGVVKGFDELLGSLRADIDTMKGDMYGIAGKKKAARKTQEVAEDDE